MRPCRLHGAAPAPAVVKADMRETQGSRRPRRRPWPALRFPANGRGRDKPLLDTALLEATSPRSRGIHRGAGGARWKSAPTSIGPTRTSNGAIIRPVKEGLAIPLTKQVGEPARQGLDARGLRWDLVPETITRPDAPFGEGSLQRFVDADFSQHHFTLIEDETPSRAAPRHLRLRRRGQQRRPQERALHPRRRREDLGHRQRALLPPRAQAAHRHLGVRRRAGPRRAPRRSGAPSPTTSPAPWPTCCRRPRSRPCAAGPGAW